MTAKFDSNAVDTIVGTYVAAVEEGKDYEARQAVMKELAAEFDATIPQIRGKLVTEKVYVKKEEAAKAATVGLSKEDLAKALNAFTGLEMTSVTKMTKKDLTALWERLVELSDIRNADEGKK